MKQTDPNIGYTISLNLDDDDPLLVQNMNAVSYTHLDVYKRQTVTFIFPCQFVF